MDARIREIQPLVQESWPQHKQAAQDAPLIPPVARGDRSANSRIVNSERSRQGDTFKVQLDPGKAKEMAEDVQQYLEDLNIQLSFKVHDKTGELVVQVLNRDTGDVVRQIPPENLIKLREKLEELRGVLFNGKV